VDHGSSIPDFPSTNLESKNRWDSTNNINKTHPKHSGCWIFLFLVLQFLVFAGQTKPKIQKSLACLEKNPCNDLIPIDLDQNASHQDAPPKGLGMNFSFFEWKKSGGYHTS